MHIASIIAALTAVAVAAPLGNSASTSVKRTTMTRPKITEYVTYGPYYLSYGSYHSAEDAQTAVTSLTKRGYSCYTSYTPYPVAMETETAEARTMQKREYGTYSPYCVYGASVEAEAMKMNMDKAKEAKRDIAIAMPKEMIMHAAEDADMTEEQNMAVVMKIDEPESASNDFSYKSYSPYSSYANYPRAADAEAAKE